MKRLLIALIVLILVIVAALPLVVKWITGPGAEEAAYNVRLYHHQTGEIQLIPMNEYLAGVVAAEMPAEFPAEALKAQAVAARTYALKRVNSGGAINSPHPEADLCDDHRHCQAWMPVEEMKEKWGAINYYRYYYKIRQAVDATGSTVITYQGNLIDPVYHAACGGKTEDSGAVWKYSVDYLQSVECPHEEDPRSVQSASFTINQIEKALGVQLSTIPVSNSNRVIITGKTDTGRVQTVQLGDIEFPAALVRERLGLRSTNFNAEVKDEVVVFTTKGYGHGVGMCQYGAKGFAEQGYTYKEILTHYYTGVELLE